MAPLSPRTPKSEGGADHCPCSGCRNFALLRDKVYSDAFRNLLGLLGIDPKKEDEAVHYGPKGELHFYGGWFYFVGELLEAGERLVKEDNQFQYWIGVNFPGPPDVFGKPVAAIEFTALLPWTLDEPYDSGAVAEVTPPQVTTAHRLTASLRTTIPLSGI